MKNETNWIKKKTFEPGVRAGIPLVINKRAMVNYSLLTCKWAGKEYYNRFWPINKNQTQLSNLLSLNFPFAIAVRINEVRPPPLLPPLHRFFFFSHFFFNLSFAAENLREKRTNLVRGRKKRDLIVIWLLNWIIS